MRTQVKLVYSNEFLRKVLSEELKGKMPTKAVNMHQNEYVLHLQGPVYSNEFLRKVLAEELKRKMATKAVNLHQNEYVLHIQGQVIRK